MSDRIVKTVTLKADLTRVWNAITNSAEFAQWFGLTFDAPFTANAVMKGTLIPNTVIAEVAAMQEPHRGTPAEIVIADIEPMRLFSFRWHPFAVDKDHDYSAEPMTLVTFELEPVAEGVLLSITESGFDQIPLARRAEAAEANDGGWMWQCRLIEAYLAR